VIGRPARWRPCPRRSHGERAPLVALAVVRADQAALFPSARSGGNSRRFRDAGGVGLSVIRTGCSRRLGSASTRSRIRAASSPVPFQVAVSWRISKLGQVDLGAPRLLLVGAHIRSRLSCRSRANRIYPCSAVYPATLFGSLAPVSNRSPARSDWQCSQPLARDQSWCLFQVATAICALGEPHSLVLLRPAAGAARAGGRTRGHQMNRARAAGSLPSELAGARLLLTGGQRGRTGRRITATMV